MSTTTGIRSGIWKGRSGGILDIVVKGEQITGTMQTTEGRPSFAEKFDVTGVTDGDLIGLVVLWRGYNSLATWAGRYGSDEKGEYIRCMWHLVRKFRDRDGKEPNKEWDSTLTNQGTWYYDSPTT